MPPPLFSPEQLAQIKAYVEPKYTWHLIQLALDFLFDIALLAVLVRPMYRLAGWIAAKSMPLVERAAKVPVLRAAVRVPRVLWGAEGSGTAMAFIVVWTFVVLLYNLPSDVYFGFFHEKAFGLSTESAGRFAWDLAKGLLGHVVVEACLVFGLFGLTRRLKYWWLILGVVAAVAMPLSTALDPLRSKAFFDSHSMEPGPLRDAITAVLVKAKVQFGDIRIDETSASSVKPDAYFAGEGPTRTVVLYDTLIALLSRDELVAAVAHEAGHADESRWKAWVGSSFALLAFLGLVELLLRWVAKRGFWGVTERSDIRALPLIGVVFTLATMVFAPVSGYRQRQAELAADRFAIELTHDPETFKSMLIKVARVALLDPDPPRWHVVMDLTHPPLNDRLAAIDALKTPTAGEP